MSSTAVWSARTTPLRELLSPAGMMANLWSQRDLVRQFTWRLFTARYRGTHLGAFWAVLFPLTLLGVYTFLFNFVFKARWGASQPSNFLEFAVVILTGMVVYGIFGESTTRAASLVVDNPNFVKKVVFPLEILPVASVGSSLIYASFGIAIALIGAGFFVKGPLVTWALFPLVLVPLVMWCLAAGWFLASLGVFVRDTGNVAGIVVGQVLFFLTPVLYKREQLGDFAWLADLNPLTSIIEGARRTLLEGLAPAWVPLGLSTLGGLIVMQLGYAFFMKSKRGFADVL